MIAGANCHVLRNPASTVEVGTALSRAAEQASDLLLVYYGGHGLLDDDGMLHLALPDTQSARPGWTGIPLDLLKRDLSRARAKARVLLLDCCFSGRAVTAMANPRNLVFGQSELSGTYILTSTTATSPSHAPPGERYTAFTGALLDALGSAEPLTLDGIYAHVDTALASRGLPRPRRQAVNTAGGLALVRGPVPIGVAPHRPPHKTPVCFASPPALTSARRRARGIGCVVPAFLTLLMAVLYPRVVLGHGWFIVAIVLLLPALLSWYRAADDSESERLVISAEGLALDLMVNQEPLTSICIPWSDISYLGVLRQPPWEPWWAVRTNVLVVRPRAEVAVPEPTDLLKGRTYYFRGRLFQHSSYVLLTDLGTVRADPELLRRAIEDFGGAAPYRTERQLFELDPWLAPGR
ncbi:caspase family protein [Streptomyces sp. LX-29]|uniref:caspase family protein n=1 Tax=Streptomyces sp. LX-29 TaxID=2900152 RepID=UPI00240DACAB|nr:caspase family protein [Streptomyces sp. LX-29]WFB10522.1 caspase family protein [Streptomyces sp. LX-29]